MLHVAQVSRLAGFRVILKNPLTEHGYSLEHDSFKQLRVHRVVVVAFGCNLGVLECPFEGILIDFRFFATIRGFKNLPGNQKVVMIELAALKILEQAEEVARFSRRCRLLFLFAEQIAVIGKDACLDKQNKNLQYRAQTDVKIVHFSSKPR